MKGFNDAGRLPSSRKGGRGRKLFERDGIFYTWQRPRGSWRPLSSRARKLGMSQYHGSDWMQHGKVRARMAETWRTRKCKSCGEVKDIWSVVRWQISFKQADGRWVVRSYHIRKQDVKHPGSVCRGSTRPLRTCECEFFSEGRVSARAVDNLALRLAIERDPCRDAPLSIYNPAIF